MFWNRSHDTALLPNITLRVNHMISCNDVSRAESKCALARTLISLRSLLWVVQRLTRLLGLSWANPGKTFICNFWRVFVIRTGFNFCEGVGGYFTAYQLKSEICNLKMFCNVRMRWRDRYFYSLIEAFELTVRISVGYSYFLCNQTSILVFEM